MTIYVSAFGKERLEKEAITGPVEFLADPKKEQKEEEEVWPFAYTVNIAFSEFRI